MPSLLQPPSVGSGRRGAAVRNKIKRGLRGLRHVAEKVTTLTVGRAYVSQPLVALRRRLNTLAPAPRFSGRIALVAHVFYPEILGEILECFATLPHHADLIVTTPFARAAEVEVLAGKANIVSRCQIVAVENRGRDIAPFLLLLNSGRLSAYDAVLKLHTKRSPHLRDGDIRRKLLFTQLAGTRFLTNSVLKLFDDSQTGMVGWGMTWRNGPNFWMQNQSNVQRLCSAIGAQPPAVPSFFEGSMFWVRPAALGRLAGLRLEAPDFEAESGRLDGTLHHAVERIFPLAVAASGYTTRSVGGRFLLTPGD